MSHYNLWLALTEIQSITFLLGSSQLDPYTHLLKKMYLQERIVQNSTSLVGNRLRKRSEGFR